MVALRLCRKQKPQHYTAHCLLSGIIFLCQELIPHCSLLILFLLLMLLGRRCSKTPIAPSFLIGSGKIWQGSSSSKYASINGVGCFYSHLRRHIFKMMAILKVLLLHMQQRPTAAFQAAARISRHWLAVCVTVSDPQQAYIHIRTWLLFRYYLCILTESTGNCL